MSSAHPSGPAGRATAAPFPLLVSLCRRDAAARIDRTALGQAELRQVLEAAERHHVVGLVLATLARLGAVAPGAADDGTAGLLRPLRRRAALLEMRRDRVIDLLDRAGVPVVVLKGSGLAVTTYADVVERDLDDLDLLVPESTLGDARRALEAAGYAPTGSAEDLDLYRRHHFHLPFVHADSHIVELHWALHRPSDPFRVDPAAVIARAVEWRGEGRRPFRMPCPEDMLLHVTLQNLQDGFSRLSRIVDVDRILVASPPREEELARAACAGGLGPSLALSLQLAARLLGTPVGDGLRAAVRPSTVVRFHLGLFDPESLLAGQYLRRTRARRRLLELWLTRSGAWKPGTRFGTPPSVGHGGGAADEPPGPLWRALFLAKIGLYQLFLYGAAAARGGRFATEFWGRPAETG